jgi:hypothetical protein
VAESEQTPSVETTSQDESVGQGQTEQVPEQPAVQDSESTTAVAVIDPPVAETPAESAIVAEGQEAPVAESVMDAQEQDTQPVDTALASDPIEAVGEPIAAKQESASEPATEVSEGSGVEDTVPVAEELQIADLPTENKVDPEAEPIPVSEPGSMESSDPSAVAEVEPTEAAVAISSEPPVDEVPTAIVSEPVVSHEVAETANPEAEHAENAQESTVGTPPIPVEDTVEREGEEKRQAVESLIVPPIPVRFVFLPIQSAQNRPGYSLRGLF